ncbi:flavodoxin family protein [Bifidobacterium sp.]|jgi:multimeric flavodoxin WrbA|uniref:flavodoxin family protein n=1 Tax=Bifidobacterium sp. TaxID=41200 RepID=UPI0025B8B33B|nr:flavodoxin family protein [Bifidobacterium sp.]MCI1634597.1 flavodoxin family protein [Bifidobacterium sp.]
MTEITPTVAIAYHSGYGHTAAVAEAVAKGVKAGNAKAILIPVDTINDEQWKQLDEADAIIFGAPTYMGGASAAFHAFAETSSKRYFTQKWAGKLAAGFTNSGAKAGDKSITLAWFQAFAAQHGMQWINLGILPGWASTTGSEDDLNRLGFFGGAAVQSPVDAGVEAMSASDLKTAEHLGTHVAQQSLVWLRGVRAAA